MGWEVKDVADSQALARTLTQSPDAVADSDAWGSVCAGVATVVAPEGAPDVIE